MSTLMTAVVNATASAAGSGTVLDSVKTATVGRGVDMTWVISPYTIYGCSVSCAIAVALTGQAIWEHITHYDYPKLQIHIVRILLMIPLYGILTVSSLVFIDFRFFIDTIRDTYESFVLYTYLVLLVQYAGGEAQLIRSLSSKAYKGIHPIPMQWLPYFRLNQDFYLRCKRFVLQYALLKPILTMIACLGSLIGVYDEASFSIYGLYLYCTVAYNLSITFSLYYLVLFELETEKELHYCRPAWKFICIKSIIFFSFWQTLTISVLISLGFIYTGPEGDISERVTGTIGDVLMCIELAPVAFMHHAAFGRKKLEDEMNEEPLYNNDEGGIFAAKQTQVSAKTNLDRAFDLSDFFKDTFETIFYRREKLVEADTDLPDEIEGAERVNVGEAPSGGGDVERTKFQLTAGDVAFLAAMQEGFEVTDQSVVRVAEDPYIPELDDGLQWLNPKGFRSKVRGPDAPAINLKDAVQEDYLEVEKPSAFCVVCGRYDRPLVKRKKGYKCVECVGTSSRQQLQEASKEVHAEDNDGSCVICGRKDRVMVRRGHKMKCIQCLEEGQHQ